MKRIKIILGMMLVFSFTAIGQNTEANKAKAQEILTKAREAISRKRKTEEIKGLSVTSVAKQHSALDYHGESAEIDDNIESENYFELQNLKIKVKEKTDQTSLFRKLIDNTQIIEQSVLNGDNFSYKRDDFVEGEKVVIPLPSTPKEESISYLKEESFPKLFPITLNFWYRPLEFYYVGVAESKDGRANIIEAATKEQTVYRLFFDEKTNLLLLIVKNSIDGKNNKLEQKFYYSDYKEMDGLLIAAKIKTEITQTNGKIIESREIKDVKVNPVFKSDFFK